jgi:four helix bundle protein
MHDFLDSRCEYGLGNFRNLTVWQCAHQFALAMYRATAEFPETERSGLVSQMRRAAVSIAANIAESRGRMMHRDRCRLLQYALGSAREVECLVLIAHELRMLNDADHDGLILSIDEIQRMLVGLLGSDQSALEMDRK